VFKKSADTKISALSDSVGIWKNRQNLVKIKIHLIENMNSEIPNRRILTNFADKSTEFTDKSAEWTVNSIKHGWMSLNRFDEI
jgi:hypothetical protein